MKVRLLYSLLFAYEFNVLIPFGGIKPLLLIWVLVVVSSFLWQYVVFHHMLRTINTTRGRASTIIVTQLLAIVVNMWAAYKINNFNYAREYEEVLREFVLLWSIYTSASGAFVGMACSHRAFRLYTYNRL